MSKIPSDSNHAFTIISGAGMSGITLAVHLLKLKVLNLHELHIFDQNDNYGGAWAANIYPGCACDVPSHGYQMRYWLNPTWSMKYAPQKEIQQYYSGISDHYGLRQITTFNTKVLSATWNEKTFLWEVVVENKITGKQEQWTANSVVDAGGQFYKGKTLNLPGIEDFQVEQWHTAQWPKDYDPNYLKGKRVAIIGTGPSTGQVAPAIKPLVKELKIYQRSATYVMPRGDGPIPKWKQRLFSWFPPVLWLYHLWWYYSFETSKPTWHRGTKENLGAKAYALAHLEKSVKDPAIRAKLTPTDEFGCKRILVLDNYLTIYNDPKVELITEKPIRFTKNGIVSTENGVEKEREIDLLIWGTGFDTTNQGGHFEVFGVNGLQLSKLWGDTPKAYYSVGVSKFPNYLLMMGPNAANFWSNLTTLIQIQAKYNCGVIRRLKDENKKAPFAVYVDEKVQKEYNEHIQDRKVLGDLAILAPGCHNYYTNEKGSPTFWSPFNGYVLAWVLRKPKWANYTILRKSLTNGYGTH